MSTKQIVQGLLQRLPEEASNLQARLAAKDLWKSEAGHRYTPEELERMSRVADVKIHRRKRVVMRLA